MTIKASNGLGPDRIHRPDTRPQSIPPSQNFKNSLATWRPPYRTSALLQDIGFKPTAAIVDLGFRGVDDEIAPVRVIHRGRIRTLVKGPRRWLKRRQAIEPIIGHTKHDHNMDRYWLEGSDSDALQAVLCAAGFNIQWLLRALTRLGWRPYCWPSSRWRRCSRPTNKADIALS